MPSSLHHYDSTDSTNECAFRSLEAGGARDGDVHLADSQTAGRGTRGRVWTDEPGQSLLYSYVHLPLADGSPLPASTGITIAAGLAVLDALGSVGFERAHLKWPNDVLVCERKLCGILVETRGFDPAAPHFVIGVGLNIAQKAFPPDLVATSLALEGTETTVQALSEALSRALRSRLSQARESPGTLCREYAKAARLNNAILSLYVAGDVKVRGLFVEIDLARGLRVEKKDGTHASVALEHITAVTIDYSG